MRLACVLLFCVGCGGASKLPIHCGSFTCDANTQICCVSPSKSRCDPASCAGGEPAYYCDGAESCTMGEHCCVGQLGGHCAAQCTSTESIGCTQNADCPTGTCTGTTTYPASGVVIHFCQ